MRRRDALKLGLGAGASAAAAATLRLNGLGAPHDTSPSTVARLTIAPVDVELAPGVRVRSIAFGGALPGSQATRSSEPATLEFRSRIDKDIVVHSSALVNSLITIPAHACAQALLRAPFDTAASVNLKTYRAYCAASGASTSRIISVGTERGARAFAFAQLQVLSIHRWQPRAIMRPGPFNEKATRYDYASFDDKLMSVSDSIKVRYGDRVRFHFSNSNTLQGMTLGLAQHRFLVVALDGHIVPTPHEVERIYIGPAESVDALVTMDRPGRWVLGATRRDDRAAGFGRLVEYAGATGNPVESDYGVADWDYSAFGVADAEPASVQFAASLPPLRIVRPQALTDAQLCDPTPQLVPLKISAGRRYRLTATNLTRDPQPLQLPGHEVELVRVAGRRTAGVIKQIVTLPSFTRVEFEFEALTNEVFLAHNRQVSLEKMPPRA
jgi:Multicopper oxidase